MKFRVKGYEILNLGSFNTGEFVILEGEPVENKYEEAMRNPHEGVECRKCISSYYHPLLGCPTCRDKEKLSPDLSEGLGVEDEERKWTPKKIAELPFSEIHENVHVAAKVNEIIRWINE